MPSKMDDAPDPQIQQLSQQFISPSEVDGAIRRAIHVHLENAPLRLLNTSTGRLCDREAQINTFMSTEYNELLHSSMMQTLQAEHITEAVVKFFSWVMLSHRWEKKEPLLNDIQHNSVYDLDPVATVVKLQKFCELARDAGHRWAWSDTCCIDQNNNAEVQRSVNSMFVWYRNSALTIVYLSDVPPSAHSGALANSVWNTRGWTVQEFLAPRIVLFYQANWTLYLNVRSPNHKESLTIMKELEDSTGIDALSLVAFRPGMTGAREKLQWASSRVTTFQEDIAYSLFGIFGIHLPVIYGEAKQNALGRLLQEIVAQSGDITALDWVGKSSEFNSCLPADISSYKAPSSTLPSLSEAEMQTAISSLRDAAVMKLASTLYAQLDNLTAPRFANRRLHLPCIAFRITAVRRSRSQDQKTCLTYEVKADGLRDMLITTDEKFSRGRSTGQSYLLVRPWNRYDLELPDLADKTESMDDRSESESPSDDSLSRSSRDNEPVDSESYSRALRLLVRLGQPFGALLLAQQHGGEYKRIASDHNIIAQVKDVAAVHDMMDIRTMEML
ncbi:heterokaryon incompatibility protein-domain-containing protein [Suillus ampliporus]|nr:heterokaryon incompatibility protein-domain-containing protein [Suillus ampliporus]